MAANNRSTIFQKSTAQSKPTKSLKSKSAEKVKVSPGIEQPMTHSRRYVTDSGGLLRSSIEPKSVSRSTRTISRKQEYSSSSESQFKQSTTRAAMPTGSGKLIMTSSELKRKDSCISEVTRKSNTTFRVTKSQSNVPNTEIVEVYDKDTILQQTSSESSNSHDKIPTVERATVSRRISFLQRNKSTSSNVEIVLTEQRRSSVTLISQTLPLKTEHRSSLPECHDRNSEKDIDEPTPFVRLHNPLRRTLPASLRKIKPRMPIVVRPYRDSQQIFEESQLADFPLPTTNEISPIQSQHNSMESFSNEETGLGLFRRSQSMRVSDLIQRFDNEKYRADLEKNLGNREDTKHSVVKRYCEEGVETKTTVKQNTSLASSTDVTNQSKGKDNDDMTTFTGHSQDVSTLPNETARIGLTSDAGIKTCKSMVNNIADKANDVRRGGVYISQDKIGFPVQILTQNKSNSLPSKFVKNTDSSALDQFNRIGHTKHHGELKAGKDNRIKTGDSQDTGFVSNIVLSRRRLFETAIQNQSEKIQYTKDKACQEVKSNTDRLSKKPLTSQANALNETSSAQENSILRPFIENRDNGLESNLDTTRATFSQDGLLESPSDANIIGPGIDEIPAEGLIDSYSDGNTICSGIDQNLADPKRSGKNLTNYYLDGYERDTEVKSISKVGSAQSPEINIDLEKRNKSAVKNDNSSFTTNFGNNQPIYDGKVMSYRGEILPLAVVENEISNKEENKRIDIKQHQDINDNRQLTAIAPQVKCTTEKVERVNEPTSELHGTPESFKKVIGSPQKLSGLNNKKVNKEGNFRDLKVPTDQEDLNLHPDYNDPSNSDISKIRETENKKSEIRSQSSEISECDSDKNDLITKQQSHRDKYCVDSKPIYNQPSLSKERAHNCEDEEALQDVSLKLCGTESSAFHSGDGEISSGERIQSALDLLRFELRSLREQDISLLRQLIAISNAIQRIQRGRALRVSKSLSFSSTVLHSTNNNNAQGCLPTSATRNFMEGQRQNLFLSRTPKIDTIKNNFDSCFGMNLSCRDIPSHQFHIHNSSVCDSGIPNSPTTCNDEIRDTPRKDQGYESCNASTTTSTPKSLHERPSAFNTGGLGSLALLKRQMSSPSSIETRRHNWLYGGSFLSSTESSISSFDLTGDLSSPTELESSTGSVNSLFASAPAIAQTQPRLGVYSASAAAQIGVFLRMPDLRLTQDVTESESQSFEEILWRNVKLWKLSCQERSLLV